MKPPAAWCSTPTTLSCIPFTHHEGTNKTYNCSISALSCKVYQLARLTRISPSSMGLRDGPRYGSSVGIHSCAGAQRWPDPGTHAQFVSLMACEIWTYRLGHCKLSFGTKKSVSSDKTDSSVPFMGVVLCDQLPAKKSTRNTVSFLLSDRPWTTGTLICHHTCQHSRCWFHLLRTELKISQRGVTSSAFFSFWVITWNTREIILLCRHPFTVNRMNVLCWNKGLLQNHYSIHH